ncbi:MAG: polar amino acid transport system substrate-binding protein [Solirubrobacteraceae bacterium]|jgi:polar amino acid transport system substrate-binding protein|nr:polar amino acid transport system substrate-binding protein [Solirubrobacteraceae bacterium]
MGKLFVRLGALALAVFAFAGCGSSSKSSSASTATSPGSSSSNAAIAAQVPAAIKSKGTLSVASEAQYAPNEFIAPDGHTVIGMDADLLHALGAQMGLKVKLINSNFETIIPGLAAGRYDLGASSFTDTKEREKTVDFVDYFQAGISFYARTSANPGVSTVAALCGKTVAVEKGTIEQEEAEKQSKTCTKEGKKAVAVLSFPGQNPVNLAVASGRAELGMADSPVVAYQVKQSGGQFKVLCKCYGFAPYGIAVPKKSGMTTPILAALKELMANGTYTQILTKWGIQSGAISAPKINGATS